MPRGIVLGCNCLSTSSLLQIPIKLVASLQVISRCSTWKDLQIACISEGYMNRIILMSGNVACAVTFFSHLRHIWSRTESVNTFFLPNIWWLMLFLLVVTFSKSSCTSYTFLQVLWNGNSHKYKGNEDSCKVSPVTLKLGFCWCTMIVALEHGWAAVACAIGYIQLTYVT